MLRKTGLFAFFLGLMVFAHAQDTLTVGAFDDIPYASSGDVSLSFSGSESLSAAQFDLEFPATLLAYSGITSSNLPAGFDVAANLVEDGRLRVLLYSTSGSTFTPPLQNWISLGFDSNTEPGSVAWTLSEVTLGDADGNSASAVAIGDQSIVSGPKVLLSNATVDFGEVPWYGTGTASATVQNLGNAELSVTAVQLDAPFSTSATLPLTVAAGGSVQLPLDLDTSSPLSAASQLTLTTSDPDPIRALQAQPVEAVVYAVNEVHVGQGSGVLGSPLTLPVSVNNQLPFSGFQFDLNLPNGTSYVSGSATLSGRATDHAVTASTLSDGTLRVLGYSPSNTPVSGDDGILVELDVVSNEDYTSAAVGIANATLSSPDGDNILSDAFAGQIQLTYPVFVLSTSQINAGDLALGTSHAYDVNLYNAGNAPLNVSGTNSTSPNLTSTLPVPFTLAPGSSYGFDIEYSAQTLGSISETLTFFHNGSPNSNAVSFTATTSSANYLQHGDAESVVGATWTLPLQVVANEAVTGIQCDVVVPDGLTLDLESVELDPALSAFSLAKSTLSTQEYRFLIYSFSGAQIPAGTTTVASMSGAVSGTATPGAYALSIEDVILSDTDGQNIASVPFSEGSLTVVAEALGCTDPTACNYDAAANTDDNSCTYVDGICETCENGVIVDNDSDNDGVCDADEIAGCQDATACNYNAAATDSNDSCTYVDGICETCENGVIVDNDTDDDGVCDADEIAGCQDQTACNYNAAATDSDDSCTYIDGICETCENGVIVDNDTDDDGVCDADEIAGCQDATACNYNAAATDSDDSCTYVDGICETCENGLIVDNDSDNDGVCDADEVAGCQDASACNYNAAATDSDDSCTYVDGICETCENGLIVDNDSDDDGVCDADEIAGCQDQTACNYNAAATDSDDSCTYVDGICETCENGLIVDNDTDNDGVCDADEIAGCQDATACNYNAAATDSDDSCTYVDGICETCENGLIVDNDSDDDGVCDADEIAGCQDQTACNYNAAATDSDDSCTYVDGICETCENGVIVDNDSDNDGVCDADEIAGCQDQTACNYNAAATDSDDSCTYVDGICETCENGVIVDNDTDNDGVCDADEIAGCQDATACNYNAAATDSDDSCTYVDGICETCENGVIVDNDTDNDGVCNADEIAGCQDQTACNYNAAATDSDDSCTYVDGICETCENGVIVDNDTDGDGVCNADEIAGCQDQTACNYNAAATDSDDSCTYVDGICETCENGVIVDNDTDNDGVCDADEIAGCQDATACNYNAAATDSDDSCTYVDGICETCENGVIVDNDTDNDGVCDADEIAGCQDQTACNYNAAATDSDDSCTYVDGICETCENGVIVDNDTDDDGVCDADEIAGCQDQTACNYNAAATDSDDSCTYVDGICETCENGVIVDNDTDDDGVCDADEIAGCQDQAACNYNAAATDSDDSCTYVDGICETCENGIIVDNDTDGDGVCNADEIAGCQDQTACNYNPAATDSDDSCTYVDGICETCENGVIVDNDTDGDGVCNADEIAGCQDQTACNYNAAATDSDASCTYVDGICETCENGIIVDNDTDGDGVCNADEIAGCQDQTACNYNAAATDSDDSCTYVDGICETCENGVIVDNDTDDDGVCDADEIAGCQDQAACNYDAAATDSNDSCTYVDGICETCENGVIVDNDTDGDGVCDADEIAGCQDQTACNYNAAATDSDDSCTYVDGICETCENGVIVDNDTDDDGVCDADEIAGCQDQAACNYNAAATDSDDSCTYVDGICETCENGVIVDNDPDGDGVCDADEIAGCQDQAACNYNAAATDSNDSCTYVDGICETCENGVIIDNDTDDDGVCDADEIAGCQDQAACNYNAAATDSDDSCTYVDGICETCENGIIVDNDTDDDGVCDANEITGCQDQTACNYNAAATDSDDSCTYVDGICETCENGVIVDNDTDGDGVCDADEIAGCQDQTACNYNAAATDSDDSCTYVDGICETCENGVIVDNDTDDDGVCDADEIAGCQDQAACNYNAAATDSDDSCTYVDGICETCENGIIVDNDTDGDGVCNADEIAGCQDQTACNYNPAATDSDDSCTYVDGICETCENGVIVDNDTDGDGVCNADEIAGCQDQTACNYNATATDSDDSCTYVDGICETCENGVIVDNDTDDDGICDADEIAGCQDQTACNYNAAATDSDNSCTYVDGICETCENGIIVDNDTDDDGVCNADEIAGCQDATACNYNAAATDSDDSCAYLDAIGECGGNCTEDDNNNGICDSEEAPPCPADLNLDQLVGAADLLVLLSNFGCSENCETGDVNGDGVVAVGDVLLLLSLYGSTCPQ